MSRPDPPFLEISPWLAPPTPRCPPLEGEHQADVAIIGAGYTGLSTALSLREAGVDVILLEQDFAGAGASGRNAGHLTPTIGKDLPTLLRVFGRERASALVRLADQAVEYTEGVFEKYAIDCRYRASGNILAGVHPKHEPRLRAAAETATKLGAHVRFLEGAELRERGVPPAVCCGVLEERGGHLDPGRYALGMRTAALAAGVRLFEGTRVVEILDESPARVRCDGGSVVAKHVVFATNAYTPGLGWLKRSVAPLRVSLFETQPLREEELASLDWPGREGLYTSHEILESYRLTDRNTIVGGSKSVRYRFGNRLAPGRDPQAFRLIESAFRERFPTLPEVPVAHFWGGWIALSLDFLPVLGSAGRSQNLHHGLGYAGHGVAQATLMGAILAERVQGRRHECESALERRRFDWPPEPVRWVASQLLNRALMAIDARTDRQIRRQETARS